MLTYPGRLREVNRTVAGLTNNILSATDFAYPMLIESDHETHDHNDKPVKGGLTTKAASEFLEYAPDLICHDCPLCNDLVA